MTMTTSGGALQATAVKARFGIFLAVSGHLFVLIERRKRGGAIDFDGACDHSPPNLIWGQSRFFS